MKKLSIKFVSIILAVGVLLSCNNDDNYPSSSVVTRSGFESNSIANLPSQIAPQNPCGYIGDIHNEFMDSIKTYAKDTSSIRQYALKFCKKRNDVFNRKVLNGADIDLYCKESAKIGLFAENRIKLDFVTDSLINQTSPTVKKKKKTISYFLSEYDLKDKNKIKSFFKDFDERITNSKALSTEDKVQILICSAVANASSQYNCNRVLTKQARQAIVKADFTGAIGGVLSFSLRGGFSTGMIFGPTGIAVGLVTSAGLGAIISSGLAASCYGL